MIPEIKRILYATDLSPNAEYAFRYAINSAIKKRKRLKDPGAANASRLKHEYPAPGGDYLIYRRKFLLNVLY